MPSNYFNPPSALLVGALAKAADINSRITAVDSGFAAVQADVQSRLGPVATAPVLSNATITNASVLGSASFANPPSIPTSVGANITDAANVQYVQNAMAISNIASQQQNAILFSNAMASLAWLNQ